MAGERADPTDPADLADICSRRAALRLALCAPALAALAACRPEPEPELPPGTLVELARLPEGERVVVMHGEEPVELVRTGRSVRARSLWCTHIGCRVRWVDQHAVYACPCHGGIFDPDGKPIAGPPTVPLRTTTLAADGGRVIIPPGPPRPREESVPPRRRPGVPAPRGELV